MVIKKGAKKTTPKAKKTTSKAKAKTKEEESIDASRALVEDMVANAKVDVDADDELDGGGINYKVTPERLIPTGSTKLNLACSDHGAGGFATGTMVNLIGGSSSGKTLLYLTMLAEMANDSRFDDYDFIIDDAEAAMAFDVSYLFGSKLGKRIITPDGESSDTIQAFQKNVLDAIDNEKPFVYILDSFDAISSDQEIDKAEEARAGKNVAGSYGMDKAKGAHQVLRMIVRKLKQTNSLLIIVSQIKDNMDMGFETKKRSGGHALKFYATHEIWMKLIGKHFKAKYKDRITGVNTKCEITKNKLNGKQRTATFSIFYDYGVDDIGSCIDFLVEHGVWTSPTKQKIKARHFKQECTREKLIAHIESTGLETELRKLVTKKWTEIEDSLKLGRKRRFD